MEVREEGMEVQEETVQVCTSKTILGLVAHHAVNTVANSSWVP